MVGSQTLHGRRRVQQWCRGAQSWRLNSAESQGYCCHSASQARQPIESLSLSVCESFSPPASRLNDSQTPIDVAPELAGQVANGHTPFVVLAKQALVRRHRVVRAAGAGAAGVAGLKVVIGGGIVKLASREVGGLSVGSLNGAAFTQIRGQATDKRRCIIRHPGQSLQGILVDVADIARHIEQRLHLRD